MTDCHQASFLFLLVDEGFSGVMSNVVQRILFKQFKVTIGGTLISHLQYADDTLCIGGVDPKSLDFEGDIERL